MANVPGTSATEALRSVQTQIYLRDIATVHRGYVEPPGNIIRYDRQQAIGIGISTVSGGNVVVMGEALQQRLAELQSEIPLGIQFGLISVQSNAVIQAIDGFVVSLGQAVVIVIVVLLFFMGLRSGLLIGFILVLTIVGSFIFLDPWGVALERISLGALIIALGMLVDNAIVVVDGMLVRMQKGMAPEKAAADIVAQSGTPLLGATFIAVLAFAAIGTSDDSTGEFCRSLFQVVLVSLSFSWVTAMTVTPVLGVMFLKPPKTKEGEQQDPYGGKFYAGYRGLLSTCIRQRWLTLGVVLVIFVSALRGFGYVEQSFFPPSTRPQFMVDLWLPQGTHIDDTTRQVLAVEDYLLEQEEVTNVTSLIGQGGLRFLLTLTPEKSSSAYANLIVDVTDTRLIDDLIPRIESYMAERFPDTVSYGFKFEVGPGANGKIRARLMGPDPNVLRGLSEQVIDIFEADPNAKGIRTDWRERVKVVRPVLALDQANLNGIRRPDVADVLRQGFQGLTVGVYRERDLLLPIILRAEEVERTDIDSIQNLQIWSPAALTTIPLRQVVSGFETVFDDELIYRRDRRRTITVFADPISGTATRLFDRLRPQVEALELPPGYMLEWGGEYEDSNKARAGIAGSIPLFILIMILVTITLFNSLKQTLVIWLNVPLAIIGVTVGLLSTNQAFGFMAILGLLSLIGMLIKNAIVLVDEMNLQFSEGTDPHTAIVESGVSRLRPVAMAAGTTALGMIPLLFDAFFVSMAVTIIGGLIFATMLTMIVLPVFYSVVFRVPSPAPGAPVGTPG